MTAKEANQNLPNNRNCPQCGTPLPAGVLAGLCPACLLKQGAIVDSATQADSRPFVPPSVEEIAGLFPQLEILAFIGKGGMGAVYKARQKQLDRIVALKILPPGIGDDPAFAERFTREAKALARLNHAGIVTLYEFGAQPSSNDASPLYYFLMEFVDGVNLRQLLQNGRIAPREALAIVPQICDALQFAHDQGIVHRDIKPENLLLDRRGRVKVADFGLAKLVGQGNEPVAGDPFAAGAPSLTDARKILGTPRYMAPEQAEHPANVDHRADIYALGVVFYQMLTGELPDKLLQPPSSKVHLDVRLDEIVLRALQREPQLRYQQASVLKTQVETVAGRPPSAVPVSQSPGQRGFEFKTKTTIWGLPLLHIAGGVDPKTGRMYIARGIFAIGNVAQGVFAFGALAMGGFAFGGLSLGVFSYGGIAMGLLAFGGASLGWLFALGGLAIAPVAIGGAAIGYFAKGGLAIGPHRADAMVDDPRAHEFFMSWAKKLAECFQTVNLPATGALVAIIITAFFWAQRRSLNSSNFSINEPVTINPKPRSHPVKIILGTVAAFLVPLIIFAVMMALKFSSHPGYGRWFPQKMIASADAPASSPGIRFGDISRIGRTVVFNLTCESNAAASDLNLTFSGPPLETTSSNFPPSLAGTLAPGTNNASIRSGEMISGTNVLHEPGTFQFGFVLPDEATADLVVKQARDLYAGKTRRLEPGRLVLLFSLLRKMWATGLPDRTETMQATLRVASHASNLQFRLVLADDGAASPADFDVIVVTNKNDDREFHEHLRVSREVVMDDSVVKRAGRILDRGDVQNIMVELTDEGGVRFHRITSDNVGRRLAIFFGHHFLTAPKINSPMGSQLQISGQWPDAESDRILAALNGNDPSAHTANFGPAREYLLPQPMANSRVFLELGSGVWTTNRNFDSRTRDTRDWLRQNHADIAPQSLDLVPLVRLYDAMVTEVPASAWDTATPNEIVFDWNLMRLEPPADVKASKGSTGDGTYFFRTREDVHGILQILGVGYNPPGIKIRCKLVQAASAPKLATSQSN